MSVPLRRPDINQRGFDSQGRYFLIMSDREWSEFMKEHGFIEQEIRINRDGTGRSAIEWLSWVGIVK